MKTFLQMLLLFCSVSVFGQISNVQIADLTLCQNQLLSVTFTNTSLSAAYPLTFTLKRMNGATAETISTTELRNNTATSIDILIPNSAPSDIDYFLVISSPEITTIQTPQNIIIGRLLTLTSASIACYGDNFDIISSITDLTSNYFWYKDNIEITNSNEAINPYNFSKSTSTNTDAGLYKLVVKKSGECDAISTLNKSILAIISPPIITGNTIIVSGNSATLSASGCSGSVNWSQQNGSETGSGSTFITQPLTQAKIYEVICIVGTCQSAKTLVNLTINSNGAPAAPTLTRSSSSICQGSEITLSASCSGGSVKWYSTSTGITAISNINPFSPPTSSIGTNTYFADCRINNITSVNRTSISFVVKQMPFINVNSTLKIYPFSSALLNATGCDGGTVKWFEGNVSTTILFTGNPYTVPPQISYGTDYYCSCTLNGCESVRDKIIIQIAGNNDGLTLFSSTTDLCTPGTVNLRSTGCSDGTVNWYNSNTSQSVLFTGQTYSPSISTIQTHTYWANCPQYAHPSYRVPISVTLHPPALMPTITGANEIVEGTATTLNATGCDASQTVRWFEGTSLVGTGNSYTTPPLISSKTYKAECYFAINSIPLCISPQRSFSITVCPKLPTVSNKFRTTTTGSTVTLVASCSLQGSVVSWYSKSGTAYTFISNGNTYTTPAITTNRVYAASCSYLQCNTSKQDISILLNNVCTTIPVPTQTSVTIPSGTSATLSATGCVGDITWRKDVGGAEIFEGSNNTPFNTPILTQNPTIYYVSCGGGLCGNNVSSNVLVTVNLSCTPPNPPNADGGQFTENSYASLTASGCNGLYKWYNSSTGTNYLQSNSSPTFTTPILVAPNITYYVSCFEGGCESTRTPIYLTILPTLKTNTTWKATPIAPIGETWKTISFDDSQWNFAEDNLSIAPCLSGGGKQIWSNQLYDNAYFRKKFYIPFIPSPSTIKFNIAGGGEVFINGVSAFTDGDCNTETSFDIDVTNKLVIGENIITAWINVELCGGDGFFCIKTNIPDIECNANISSITSNSPISSGGTASMTASGCSGTYRWYNQASGGNIIHTNPSYIANNITVSTTYYVSCFNPTANCESPRIAKNINVIANNNGNCSEAITLQSTIDDYSSGAYIKTTNETITATNKVINTTQALYRSNKGIFLNPGFKAEPTSDGYFKTEIGGCN